MTAHSKFTIKLLLLILLAFIFTLYIVHFTLLRPAYAQSSASSASSLNPTPYTLPSTISPTSPLYTDLLVNNLFHSFSCLAIGQSVIGQPCLTYQVTKNAQGALQSVPVLSQVNLSGGVLGSIGSVIDGLYMNPPIRTTTYLATLSQDLGIVKEVHAQVGGSGAGVLNPILSLWQVSRNISYVIMIIIFLIVGLMVMFRNKINPQTVITAQAALPGLVIGLILITFSYFLAALITDMAFVGINVVGYYFSAAQNQPATQNLVADVSDESILAIFSRFIGIFDPLDTTQTNSTDSIFHALEVIFNNLSPGVQNFIRFAIGLAAFQYGNQIGHIVPVVGDLAGIIVGVGTAVGAGMFPTQIAAQVLSWVTMVVLIYSMFKLLIRLINNYLTIIFLTITAPFQFLAASLPGRQGIATGWILNMLASILAFPAVLAVLYFVAFLLQIDRAPFNISGQVELISPTTLPLFGGLDTRFINVLLAFGALIALPAIPDIISRSVGRAGAAGQLIGQELSGNIRGGQGYSNQFQTGAQGVGKIGQDWNTFRGVEPGYNPAGTAKIGFIAGGRVASTWTIPKGIPIIGGRQPFTRKRVT